jgi:hypothetical protein
MSKISIPFAKSVKTIRSQKRNFGSSKGPSHPDPEMFRPENLEQVIDWMVLWQIEPYWGENQKTGKRGVRFRSIPRKGGWRTIPHQTCCR